MMVEETAATVYRWTGPFGEDGWLRLFAPEKKPESNAAGIVT